MLIVQMLLPRFLVLEVVLLIHFLTNYSSACIFTLASSRRSSNPPEKCSLSMSKYNEMGKLNPLYLNEYFNIVYPTKDGKSEWSFDLSDNERIVGCPGTTIKGASSVAGTIKGCGLIQDIKCSRSIKESIENASEKCVQNKGSLFRVGFRIPISLHESTFHTVYKVCHDVDGESTFYTSHTIKGRSIGARQVGRRPSFKEGGFFKTSSANNAYKTKNQEKTFKRYFSSDYKKYYSRRDGLFFSRGHLTPDADFVFNEFQDTTYYYFNVAPQWQVFNEGNWLRLEEVVRDYAEGASRDVLVFTGTHGVLKLNNQTGYLSRSAEGRIPVPLYFWKLLYDPSKHAAMSFVGVNDPHVTNKNEVPHLCPRDDENLCERNRWMFDSRRVLEDGYLYCCKFSSLSRSITWTQPLLEGFRKTRIKDLKNH